MQVGEEDEAGAQITALGGLRFLDFEYERRTPPYSGGRIGDAGAGRTIFIVGEAAPQAGAALHEHRVAVMAESGSARGRERHAAFVGFDLGRDSNDHRIPPLPLSCGSQRSRAIISRDPQRKIKLRTTGLTIRTLK